MPKKHIVYQYKTQWWKRSWDKILYLLILAVFFLFYPGQNIYTLGETIGKPIFNKLPFAMPTPAPYPANATGISIPEDIIASGVVIIDIDSGVHLYKRNEEELFSPASTTKILTALVALDTYSLDDVLTVKSLANAGQAMGLVAGERITVENLLYGALVQSGNDAAFALAENYPGGVEKFVEAMNAKAKAIHLTKSFFANPVGYDDPNQRMTPTDLARLAVVALTNPVIAKIVAIPQITISDVTHTYFHALKNVNQLLGKIPGVGGIKTGWTEEAGENLVTYVERNSHRVIFVVLHSKDRFGETAKLIDWVFGNFTWQQLSIKE